MGNHDSYSDTTDSEGRTSAFREFSKGRNEPRSRGHREHARRRLPQPSGGLEEIKRK
jgi:hypothetical protein